MFSGVFRGARVLVTGHTGFKGSWLCLWLKRLGAEVAGLSLDPPSDPFHFALLDLDMQSFRGDIRSPEACGEAISAFAPELVFHLAAQPLVRRSHDNPVETMATNVMGTVHLFEACRKSGSVRAIVNITSDKCYENREWVWGYREIDPMGGHDPYSASKGCAELVSAAWRRSFFAKATPPILLASARAGNVIGGGDWGADRLVPDIVRATVCGETTLLRNPDAVRPWQHVLEPLAGYLQLAQALLLGEASKAEAWNFGPTHTALSVGRLAGMLAAQWPKARFSIARETGAPHEAGLLMLDSSRARSLLGFRSILSTEEAVEMTVAWYRAFHEERRVLSAGQLEDYLTRAGRAGLPWAGNPA